MITVKSCVGADLTPSEWVVKHAPKIRTGGRVIDYACGSGRHSLWLAAQGYEVLAIDRDPNALLAIDEQAEQLSIPQITTQLIDLEGDIWPFNDLGVWDGLVVTNYLYRPFLHKLPSLLKDEGVLIYETFALGNEAFGKPSNPDFLLRPNELLGISENMTILAYEDFQIQSPKRACIQRICAVPLQSKT